MKIKSIFPLVLFMLAGVSGFSASLEELLGEERAAALINGETITQAQLKNPEFLLMPRHAGIRRLAENVQTLLRPTILVETLSACEKPAGAGRPGWTEEERRGLFNQSVALSTLTGLQYYSASRKTMRTLYESSAVIDGPDTKRPLPDPVYPEPPAELTIYARQKDLTFGDNIFRYDYYAPEGALVFIQQNLTPMTAGIIPAVGKNNLYSLMAVIDAGDYLLLYAASLAKAASVPGMGQRISNSFSTRAEAVMGWFAAQAGKVFGTP